MIKTDGKSWPLKKSKKRWIKMKNKAEKSVIHWIIKKITKKINKTYNSKWWHRINQKLKKEIEIFDGQRTFMFRCDHIHELRRAMRIFIKEPGTIEWIKKSLRPGDVFYDIGSNIGIYTIYAANFVGDQGKIYSFEPHSVNFSRLLDNIDVNHFFNRIIPCNFALHDEKGYFDFIYSEYDAGSSNHQLIQGKKNKTNGDDYKIAELKFATTIDDLIENSKIRPPQHIKIDVDGNEMLILKGMSQLLKHKDKPRSIQVELDKDYKEEILDFMKSNNYFCKETHYTQAGIKKIEAGQDPEQQVCNAIFYELE